MKLNYQNYKHYKLPITMNPLEYGKLIYQNINTYVICFNRLNIALIIQNDLNNHVKIYREGNFVFEYNDHKIDDNSFVRSIENVKFTFKNNKLISINSKSIIVRSINKLTFNNPFILSVLYNLKLFKIYLFKFIENSYINSYIFKNYRAELFILFELILILLI
jgi:hypothetical protein